MKNKRLARVAEKAVKMNLGGGYYLLDGYNNTVITSGVSFAVTTRISASCDHFLMEIYEDNKDTAGDETGIH